MKAGLPSYTEDMKPVILHSDMNNFYASVEILYDPTLRDKPVAVAGDEEARHGIVLAKNDIAKRFGIRTGQVLWEARQQCLGLVCVPAHYERYLAFSAQARDIYASYTDQVESFGLDECWLDVTGSVGLFGEGAAIADDIRGRMKRELGLTVSIGVSFNKVFAKLGSDMKKPDATTVITPENYRDKAWSLPVSDLLYVGPATTRKLNQYGITTIGELAQANPDLLYWLLGKNGIMLHQFANGQDHSGVRRYYAVPPMKSIGNSTTAPRDLVSEDDVKITLMALCEIYRGSGYPGQPPAVLRPADQAEPSHSEHIGHLGNGRGAVPEASYRQGACAQPVGEGQRADAGGLRCAVVAVSGRAKSPAPGRHRPDAGQNPGQVRVSQHPPGHCAGRPGSGSGRQRGAYHPSHRLSGNTQWVVSITSSLT